MIRGLLPRIIRFRRCSKGVSTVIGTIFLVLIALTVATNVFLWTFTQNATYNQAVKESTQMDAYRSSERIVASNTNYSIPQLGTIEVSVTVSNEGPISAQILTLWVLDENTKKYSFNDTLNINLNPGDTLPLTIRVAIPGVSSTGTFNAWLVTARGNLVPLESERGIIVAQLAQGIGSISMDFTAFRHYEPISSAPTGVPAVGDELGIATYSFTIPGDEWTVFAVELTNLDESGNDIILHESSCIWLLAPPDSQGGVKGDTWGITRVADNKLASFTPKVLGYKQPTTIYFGPWYGKTTSNRITAVNVLLFGTIGDDDYGQNIPFISIYVT